MRIYGLIEYWNRKLAAIEKWLKPREPVYSGEDWERDVRDVKYTTHDILIFTIWLLGGLGAACVLLFFITPLKPSILPQIPTPAAIEERLERRLKQSENTVEQLQRKIEQLEQQQKDFLERLPKSAPQPKVQRPQKGAKR